MKILKLAILNLLVLSVWNLPAEPPAAVPPAAADPLTEVLPILQSKYADFAALNYKPGDKLSDLIARSRGGISLGTSETASSPTPIVSATLPGGVIYWRLSSFTPEKSWTDMATQLEQASGSASGIILDLRSNKAPDDYPGAAEVLRIFAPGDSTLARYQPDHSSGVGVPAAGHPLLLPIVVLTNNRTAGSAEALAACLQADGALVVGRATAGKMGVFEEQKLSSGQVLRVFVSPIAVGDPSALLKLRPDSLSWNHPVTPDITPAIDDHSEKVALTLIKDDHILDVIEETPERHRMSEASLVQGQDPEWDDYLATLEDKPVLLSLPVIHDSALISALDSLKAIRLSQRPSPTEAPTDASSPISTSVQ
jgi:hypothetical protein